MARQHRQRTWFRDAGFGMFIHWGVYAIPARGEWVMLQERIPREEYERLAQRFNPRNYDPGAWAALAREVGMTYMVLTARHHDGFCLFDSQVSDFTSVKTAARRDLVAEYVQACREAGLKVGLYYSLIDWRWPVAYEGPDKDPRGWKELTDYVYAQVEELCTNYGRIDLLWYDGGLYVDGDRTVVCAHRFGSRRLNAMVRRLQPHIVVNDRAGLRGDFHTSEQHIRPPERKGRPWESCMTINTHWGYCRDDRVWKQPKRLVNFLTACAATEGNYLLNVGPRADGAIPAACVRRLRTVGEWVRRHQDAVYGMSRSPLKGASYGMAAVRDGKIYLYVHFWSGRSLTVPGVKQRFRSARILTTGQQARIEYDRDRLILRGLPAAPPDPLCTVIVLQ